MAYVYGKKSKYLINNDVYNYSIGLILALLLFVLIYIFNTLGHVFAKIGVLPLAIIFIASFRGLIRKSKKLFDVSERFSNGRKGEYAACDLLETLPDEYSIYRNIRIADKWDTDLVVLGPTGVFAIEIKSHAGNIYKNGENLERNHKPFEKNFITQARGEALELKTYLSEKTGHDSLFVNAVLVFSNAKANLCFPSDAFHNLQVIRKDSLIDLIKYNKFKLSKEQIFNYKAELDKLV